MARIGIAFVGTGFIAGYHLDALATIPDADIRIVVGRDPAKAASFAAQRGIPAGTSDLDATLARADIGAIVVASPDDTHESICLKAIEARKAILVQKPMAPDAATCRRMIAAAQEAKVDLQVSFMHRYFEEFAAARDLIATGAIGTPTSARMRNATPGPDWGDWFFKKSRVGGGVVLQLGVHGIDLLTQLFGPVASLNATTAILRPERRLADGRVVTVENPDSAWATYRFANGVAASHDMSMIEAAGTDRFGMEIYGTDGTIQLRGVAGPLRLRRKGASTWETPVLPTSPLGQRHHQRWLDGLSGAKPKETTARDALAGLLIAEAIERSAARAGAATQVEQP